MTAEVTARFNPFAAEFRRDPYPMYRVLRETRPVHKTMGMWVLTRHADVRAVLCGGAFSAALIPALVSRQAAATTGGTDGDRLDDEEAAFICVMCFVAGHETTKSMIGNGLLALLRHPEQGERLRRDPRQAGPAVTEALRYDSPLQLTKRVAIRDVEIGGHLVSAGEQVLLCLGAANRDPEAFGRPDEFDISRDAPASTPAHLALGHGMHGCLGGALAQLQATVAFECLYRLPGRLEPAVPPSALEWQDRSLIVRGLKRLPVTLRGDS